MRKLVLSVAAVLSVAVVIALFVLRRNTTHEVATPLVEERVAVVGQRADVELDAVPGARTTNNAAERVEVAAPTSDVLDASRLRFAVVDARTLQPIEEFGMRVCPPKSDDSVNTGLFEGQFPFHFEVTDHTGGICELMADAGVRGYQIRAPGYAFQEGWLDNAARTSAAQTLRLERGGSISGRVLLDGKPASSVGAFLRRANLDEPLTSAGRYDLSEFLGTHAVGRLKDGELLLLDLPTGTYSVEIRASRGLKLVLDRIGVKIGIDTSVGDLELLSNPVANGIVLFPEGRIPPNYKVSATCADHVAGAEIDSAGKFTIDSLPAGRWEFHAPAAEAFVCDGEPIDRDISVNVASEITLDLRDRIGGWLNIAVRINGHAPPVAAAQVDLLNIRNFRIPSLDERGQTRTWLNGASVCHVLITSGAGLPLMSRTVEVAPTPGAERTVAFDIEAGELIVDCAGVRNFVGAQLATLSLESEQENLDGSHELFGWRDGPGPQANGTRFELGVVTTGAYRALLVVFHYASAGQPRPSIYVKTIAIRAREEFELIFTEADLVK